MAKAELKTKKTEASVAEYLSAIDDVNRRKDCETVIKMMTEVTGAKPKMWGTSIIGFGDLHYKYASGREGDWFKCGLSSRKAALTLYLMYGISKLPEKLARLGKYKAGKGCLYVKSLKDIDLKVLKEMIQECSDCSDAALIFNGGE